MTFLIISISLLNKCADVERRYWYIIVFYRPLAINNWPDTELDTQCQLCNG